MEIIKLIKTAIKKFLILKNKFCSLSLSHSLSLPWTFNSYKYYTIIINIKYMKRYYNKI